MGVKIAATSSVTVTTHAVSSRLAPSSSGSSAWIGTTSVNMNDDARPVSASTATMAPVPGHPGESSSRVLIRSHRLRLSALRGAGSVAG